MLIAHSIETFFSPPVPFFFIGIIAVLVKSDLEIPDAIAKFLSMYLLMAIGFKGGVELYHGGFDQKIMLVVISAVLMSVIVTLGAFFVLRQKITVPNAAALAAAFGSVSTVTFITAANVLQNANIPYGGEMVAAMSLMESPPIIIGAWLYRRFDRQDSATHQLNLKELLRKAFLNSSVIILLGSLLVGLLSHDRGMEIMKPFTGDIFKGMLSFFLLDMGIIVGRRIGALKQSGLWLIGSGIIIPLMNVVIGIGVGLLLKLSPGNAFMFMVLCASASYIAVPAAMRATVPEANPGIYVPIALGVTFPFNIVLGLPLYFYFAHLIFK